MKGHYLYLSFPHLCKQGLKISLRITQQWKILWKLKNNKFAIAKNGRIFAVLSPLVNFRTYVPLSLFVVFFFPALNWALKIWWKINRIEMFRKMAEGIYLKEASNKLSSHNNSIYLLTRKISQFMEIHHKSRQLKIMFVCFYQLS